MIYKLIPWFIVAMAGLIPVSIILGFYYDEPYWYLVTVAAFIFFMAG